MSGRRCKALRRAFCKEHGRAPAKTTYEGSRLFGFEGGGYRYIPSEWRRLKKAHRQPTSNAASIVLAAHRGEIRRMAKRDARKKRQAVQA